MIGVMTSKHIFTYHRLIRVSACDQFFYIVTKANNNSAILVSFISQLFSAVEVSLMMLVDATVLQYNVK